MGFRQKIQGTWTKETYFSFILDTRDVLNIFQMLS